MQYEANSSHLNRLIRAERVQSMNFPLHLHYSFEFFYIQEGEILCTVEQTEYTLRKGEGILILPNQSHNYRTPTFCQCIMFIFDPIYVNEFYRFMQGKTFASPVFRPVPASFDPFPEPQDIFLWKSVLYSLCAQANEQCRAIDSATKKHLLTEQVLQYIRENLNSKIQLEDLAKQFGYSYHYLSNCIKENFGMNFCTLVNHYRVDKATTLLRTTNLTMTQIADQSGFSTIRSFNRAFQKIHNVTPSQFAQQSQNK